MEFINRFLKNERLERAVVDLIEVSKLNLQFFVMVLLSWLFGMIWILLNDNVVLIASMVLAPLLNPILAFSAWITLLNFKLILYATKSILWSVLFIIILIAITQRIIIYSWFEFDISLFLTKFTEFNVLFLFAAFLSWFAWVYSWIKETQALSLVWVAIAVSIIPFLSFIGILLWMWMFNDVILTLNNFLYNLLFIIWWATCAFVLLWVFSNRAKINKEAGDEIV